MFLDVERYVEFIAKNKLAQSQFLMLYCIYKKKYNAINIYKEEFPNPDGSMIGEILKEDLISRGFIKKVNNENKADSYEVTDKFTHIFVSDIFNAADEVWDIYPPFIKINGVNTPLTNMDKFRFTNLYGERIRYSQQEHKEVIEDIRFGRENNLIRTSIENFTRAEAWNSIRKIRILKQEIKEVTEDNY